MNRQKKPRGPGKGRLTALAVVCGAVFALFALRLGWMQFLQADHYARLAAELSQTRYQVTLPAARGDIVDAGGRVLARDATAYDLTLCLPAPPGTDLTETLRTLETLNLKTCLDGEDVETHLAAFFSAASAGELPLAGGLSQAQAAELYAAGLPQSGAVRLTARGVRTRPDGALLPHALGDTGAITAEQWQADNYALQKSGVAMNADIGQSGLEKVYDELLRGRSGTLLVHAGYDGTRAEQLLKQPQAGATLVLTLDSALQRTVQAALQDHIKALQARAAGDGRECRAGAAVVVDVQTGGVLAAVSCPGYDLNSWRSGYAALAADSAAPLLDRVCSGLYAPGSAFKPAVAAAALAAGTVTPQDTVNCTGRYTFYSGYQPRCLQISHAGPVALHTALQHSCNIYFYDVGRRVGVDAFSAAAQRLGLAADTGAELPAAAGRLTWSTDENYQDGLALQAAIGQGNTAVTPLQLAAYAAALARGGERPALHFAEKAVDANGKTVWAFTPQTLDCAPGGEAVFGPIREGMTAMAQTLAALRGSPVTLACKTGSPQRPERAPGGGYYTNSVLIGYFPAEAPRYAAAVVLEYGGGGANAAPVLRSIVQALYG